MSLINSRLMVVSSDWLQQTMNNVINKVVIQFLLICKKPLKRVSNRIPSMVVGLILYYFDS